MSPRWLPPPRPLRPSVDHIHSVTLLERYPYQVCYHEAGHAFACWYVGIPVYRVQVRRRSPKTRSHWITTRDRKTHTQATGVSEAKFTFKNKIKESLRNGSPKRRSACLNQICISLAGPLNTQTLTGANLKMLLHDTDDGNMIQYCCAWADVGPNAYAKILKRIKSILNLPQSRRAMWLIAERLSRDGSVWGREVELLCAAAFADQPTRLRISNGDNTLRSRLSRAPRSRDRV